MYVLEIETKNHIKRIEKPRKARSKDLIFRVIVQVMDGDGKWHLIGHTFYPIIAEVAVKQIDSAINDEKEYVNLNLS